VRPQPVERLIAAAFWKLVADTDGTLAAEIQWATLPALGEQVRAFLEALVASVTVLEPGAATIASAEWLAADHPAAAALRAVGFAAAGTRTYYQADAAVCRNALGTPPQAAVNTLLITPPQVGHFDCLRTLLCGASLRPSELAHGCNTASSEAPSLFDPRCSGVVLADGMVVAACLANASRGHISLAALAGPPDACAHLLHHCLQGRDHLPQPVTLSIHLDERDRPAALAALLEQLPFQNAGQLVRYERPVSARKTRKSKCAKSFATEINVALHGRTGGTRCLPSQAGSLQRA